MKRFLEWIGLKERLDGYNYAPPRILEGDLWWVSLGENVGLEIGGKSRDFSRPAVVLKKFINTFYLVAPTTTRKRIGDWFAHITFGGQDEYVCLHQIRSIDYRRFHTKIGEIDTNDFVKIKEGFRELYF